MKKTAIEAMADQKARELIRETRLAVDSPFYRSLVAALKSMAKQPADKTGVGVALLLRGMALQIQMVNPDWPGARLWLQDADRYLNGGK